MDALAVDAKRLELVGITELAQGLPPLPSPWPPVPCGLDVNRVDAPCKPLM